MPSTIVSALLGELLTLASIFSSVSAASLPRPTVTVADGPIAGIATSVPHGKGTVHKYLGVPFAESPPLRFALPQDPKPWNTTLDASAVKPACIQQFSYPESIRDFQMRVFNPGSPPESEDCLYLNVFTPATAPPPGGWAVMFWIYGGNLQFGDAGLRYYDGSSFAANQDVIIVTSNYRTNIFGFPNAPQIPFDENNVGFYDQRKALDWVANNIHQFGGDPTKVTLFGESAGGYSVKQLISAPPNPLNFRAAIMESEAAFNPPEGNLGWEYVAAQLGCLNLLNQVECMRTKDALAIKSLIEHAAIFFYPYDDGITQVVSVSAALASGAAAPVPILIGTNSQEGRAIASPLTNVSAFLQDTFPNNPLLQIAIELAYPVQELAYFVVSDIITDYLFLCPAALLARDAIAAGHRVWRYYFDAAFPNMQIFPNAGVFHTSEIPEVFGTYHRAGDTPQQVALSAYMQGAWANFAKNPQAGPGWAPFTLQNMNVGDLGGDGSNGEFNINAASIETNCFLYDPLIAA